MLLQDKTYNPKTENTKLTNPKTEKYFNSIFTFKHVLMISVLLQDKTYNPKIEKTKLTNPKIQDKSYKSYNRKVKL